MPCILSGFARKPTALEKRDGYPAWLNRILNIVCGAIYTGIISLTMWSGAHFIFYGVIEITLTLFVIALAWAWPKTKLAGRAAAD